MQEPLLQGVAQTEQDRKEPILRPGNTNCGGCGMSNAWQLISRAVADRPIQVAMPACCGIVSAGPYPLSAYGAPVFSTTFAACAAVAAGLSTVAELNGEETRVIAWAGDGGTFDIGMATVSAGAERNDNILYVCYDNEIYGNTGGQRSSATPLGAATSTTPVGKDVAKKDILGIMAAHGVPYVASLSLAHVDDMMRKLRHALDAKGFRFLHILAPCPTGWKSEPSEGLELVRLAVRSGLYPVVEIFDGIRTVINVEPEMSKEALERYFAAQGRFRRKPLDMDQIQQGIARHWRRLRALAELGE